MPVDRGDRRPASASARPRSRPIWPGCSRATATSSSSTMGRGGPPEPELIEAPPSVDELVALSRSGRHAASDHLEIAAVDRRAHDRLPAAPAGGSPGRPFVSNVLEGARLAAEREPGHRRLRRQRHRDPAHRGRPARARRRRRATTSTRTSTPTAASISDLVVSVGGERGRRDPGDAPAAAARAARGPGRGLRGRSRRRSGHLDAESCTSRRASATATRCSASCARLDADTYLIEVKGAAIDLVAEDALARGRRVVLAGERRRRRRGSTRRCSRSPAEAVTA